MLNRITQPQLVITTGKFILKLRTINASIEDRFNQPAFKVYVNLEMLLLKAAKAVDISKEIEYLTLKF